MQGKSYGDYMLCMAHGQPLPRISEMTPTRKTSEKGPHKIVKKNGRPEGRPCAMSWRRLPDSNRG